MPFVPQPRTALRDDLLAFLQARYRAVGASLSLAPGTPAYREYDALCVLFEGTQVAAAEAAAEIFPDTASDDGVAHHGAVDGVDRKPATAAVLRVQITGTPSATVTFGSSTLNRFDGAAYAVSASPDGTGGSVALDGSGNGVVYATAQTPGADGNLESGTLTWSSTPVNANPTATVTALQTTGADAESFGAWAQRIIARRRDRPGGGNRADWQEWTLRYPAAAEAYVYPLLHGVLGPGTPGCVTVVPMGFAPTDPFSFTPSRILVTSDATKIRNYIEGTGDLAGHAVTGEQLRPVTMDPNDARVIAPPTTTQNVIIVCSFSGVSVPAWYTAVGIQTTGGGSTTSVPVNTDLTVPPAAVTGDWLAVANPAYRGGWEYAQIDSVSPSTITLRTPLSAIPAGGLDIIAATQSSRTIAGNILGVFDRLGPGDVGLGSSRWPTPATIGPATLYRTALIVAAAGAPGTGVVAGAPGVVSATVTTPVADVTPAGTAVLVPGTIKVVVQPA